MPSVLQPWVQDIPMMQQTVLLTAIRGPDGVAKYSPPKMLLRWYRRCILLSAMDGKALNDPLTDSGGSFTGPSLKTSSSGSKDVMRMYANDHSLWIPQLEELVTEYLRELDAMPLHWHKHFMHGCEILGYQHPTDHIRAFWNATYLRFCNDMHHLPEPLEEMNARLGDDKKEWLKRTDPALVK